MSSNPDNRRSDLIEADIERNRRNIEFILDTLQHKLAPGRVIDQAYRYMLNEGGEFAHNFGHAIKTNPIPLTLAGIGIGWMMIGSQRASVGADTVGTRTYGVERRSHGYDGGWRPTGASEAGNSHHGVGDGADDGQSIAGRVKGAAERAREGASDIGERAGEMAQDAADRMHRASDVVRDRFAQGYDRVAHGYEGMRESGVRAGETMMHRGEQITESLQRVMRDHPIAIGALALSVGAVVAAMLPSTRREDEIVGPVRDDLARRAAAAAEDGLEAAVDVVEHTAEHARSEAKRRDLAGAGHRMGELAREEIDKAGEVATSTIDKAADEIEQRMQPDKDPVREDHASEAGRTKGSDRPGSGAPSGTSGAADLARPAGSRPDDRGHRVP